MNPWLNFWFKEIYLPLSGGVEQDINAWANFLSPQIAFNFAGSPEIEKDVVGNIASYGTQLSLLTKAVLELAKESPSDTISELTSLTHKIDQVKRLHKDKAVKTAHEALTHLKQNDPDALERLLSSYRD